MAAVVRAEAELTNQPHARVRQQREVDNLEVGNVDEVGRAVSGARVRALQGGAEQRAHGRRPVHHALRTDVASDVVTSLAGAREKDIGQT